ncbi:MAG: PAS domain-containing protein, partial [Gallionella sp.]|nr:PAS domain-containing protein [Gallionella sp.]
MSRPKIHILIVEDDLVDRMACRRALAQDTSYEFVLSEAETGREGLKIAHQQKPDCVLLDYHLPDMNGLEFLVELRNDLGEITVPVMMLTGADNTSVAVEAMKRGAQDYLVKDANRQYLELLPAVIQRVLRERQALTEKKQMESRLVQAEAKYRFLVEQIPAITYTAALDIPGKLLYVSPQLSTLGYSPEEWTSQVGSLRSYIHPDDRTRVAEAFDNARATGKPLRCEYRLLNRAGEVRWFLDEASLVYDESGSPLLQQGMLIDITKDKLLEEELRVHRRRIDELVATRTTQCEQQSAVFKSANANLAAKLTACTQAGSALRKNADQIEDLYQNAPCAYHSLDADGVFVKINDTGLEWLGRTREEVVGNMRFTDLLTTAGEKTFLKCYQKLKEGEPISDLEIEIARGDGTHLSVLLSANAIKDAGGRFLMSRSVMFD